MEIILGALLLLGIFGNEDTFTTAPVHHTFFEQCSHEDAWKRYGTMEGCIDELKHNENLATRRAEIRGNSSSDGGAELMRGVGNAIAGRDSNGNNLNHTCTYTPGPYGTVTSNCN